MKRREFIKVAGTFFAVASLGGLPGCGDDGGSPSPDAGPDAPDPLSRFPQGVASGDPRDTSVVLWTRAVPDTGAGDVPVRLEVASDAGFATIVVMQDVTATAAADHTVRVIVTGLAPNKFYYYRFTALGLTISGRTRTAPAADADVPVRFALVSCQDYAAGHYGAYRLMREEDEARAEADQLHAVLHVGDFIYETRGDGFQAALDENLNPITVMNPDGTPRVVSAFPSGGGMTGTSNWANTVDDYRHLYKLFGSDPDLMAMRARTPFIHEPDDHEFTNDSWQSQANYTNGGTVDEGMQRRKVAANQAWFEYMPVQLTGAPGVSGVTQRAKDFTPVTVSDAAFTAPSPDNFVPEANNVAAVGSMTLYRSLRFGRHVELVVTDERSYRSDHAIPEEFATSASAFEYLDPRNVLPYEDLTVMDAGATYPGGAPATVGISARANPRLTSPAGTMLGAQQRQWWKDTMRLSTATWKVWANQVPFMQFKVLKGTSPVLVVDRLMDGDAWDGYGTERRELTSYLRDQNIKNVVLLTGDIHAQFAGVVMHDFNAAAPVPVATEFIAAGVASNSLFSFYESAARSAPAAVRALVTYDASASGGARFVENLNMLLFHGTDAAATMARTNDRAMALAQSDRTINPHLRYADSNAQGYGVALFTATSAEVTLTTVDRPIRTSAPTVKRRARFTVPKDNPGGMTGPTFEGTPPFPF